MKMLKQNNSQKKWPRGLQGCQNGQRGFTFIEVTMVIAMISLLVSIVALFLAKANKNSADTLTSQIVRQMKSELEINALEHAGVYPESTGKKECIRDMTGTEWPDKIKKIDSNKNKDFCVRYFKSPDANMAEIWAPLVADVDGGFNRKIGAVFGAKDINEMVALCIASKQYPTFSTRGNGTLSACKGQKPFDRVLEVDSGAPAN